MRKSILKHSLLGLLAAAVMGLPVQLHAEGDAPAVEKKSARGSVLPFHGKLKTVDNAAKTIAVGERTFQITSDTRIFKDGKAATLADAVVGDETGGSYKKTDDGKLDAVSVHFGPKPATAKKEKKEKKNNEVMQ